MKKVKQLLACISFVFVLFIVPMAEASVLPAQAEETVYITATGAKYHTHQCGNGNYYPASLSTALAKGLTPCQKCYGGSGSYVPEYPVDVIEPEPIPEPEPEPVIVSLSKRKLTLIAGQRKRLILRGATETVQWTSGNPRIASVKNGRVTAEAKGKTVITAAANGQTKQCTVLVESPKLSRSSLKLAIKEKQVLKLKGCSHKVKWSSNRPQVATVSKKGRITAKEPGTAVIKAVVHGKTYRCRITVRKPSLDGVTLSQTSCTMNVEAVGQLNINATPKNLFDYYSYRVSSSDHDVVTVIDNEEGSISLCSGRKTGNAVITVTIGKKTLRCNVTVVPPQITNLYFLDDSLMLSKNDTGYLYFDYTPWNGLDYYTPQWTSSDESIVKVDSVAESGRAKLISFEKAGEAVVTLRLGDKSVSCKVAVREEDEEFIFVE